MDGCDYFAVDMSLAGNSGELVHVVAPRGQKWGVNLMSKSDDKTTPGAKQSGERIDNGRREALVRFGKYTAPAMLAMLASVDGGMAHTPISPV